MKASTNRDRPYIRSSCDWLETFGHQQCSHSQGNIIFQDISRTKLTFSRTKYTSFTGNKWRFVWKSIFVQCMTIIDILWYSLLLTPSSCLINPFLFNYIYWPHYSFSSTKKFSSVICIRGLSSGPFLLRKYFFQDISRTFSDIVKFQDISRTWKMNLLFSRFSRTRGNLQSDVFTRISSNVMTNNLICSCLCWAWLWPDVSFQLHTSNLRSTFGR